MVNPINVEGVQVKVGSFFRANLIMVGTVLLRLVADYITPSKCPLTSEGLAS